MDSLISMIKNLPMKRHIFLLAALCISCSNSAKFEVFNQSNVSVDSVTISNGTDLLKLKEIRPGQSQIRILKFSTDTNGDGNYQAQVWIKKTYLRSKFGYYNNGIPNGSKYDVSIKKDTIIVNEKFSF